MQLQFFVSFACLMNALDPALVEDVHSPFAWRKPKTLFKRCNGNTKCHYESGCVKHPNGARMCLCADFGGADHDRFKPAFGRGLEHCIAKYQLNRRDIVLYGSVALHYTGEMHADAENLKVAPLAIEEAKAFLNLRSRPRGPFFAWRSATAQHFASRGGHFVRRRMPNYNILSTMPCSSNHTLTEMEKHQVWNKASLSKLAGLGVPVLDVWYSTALAWDAHVSGGDCTHWCLPGLPDAWGPELVDILLEDGARSQHSQRAKDPNARHVIN